MRKIQRWQEKWEVHFMQGRAYAKQKNKSMCLEYDEQEGKARRCQASHVLARIWFLCYFNLNTKP